MSLTQIAVVFLVSCVALSTPAFAQNAEEKKVLELHNMYRAQHAAQPLTWDSQLAQQAAAHAARCKRDSRTEPGTDQAAVLSTVGSKEANPGLLEDMVKMWYAGGMTSYDFKQPESNVAYKFTQMLWKSSAKLGCAVNVCNELTGFGQGGTVVVCRYSPAGNVKGEFAKNVSPRSGDHHRRRMLGVL